MNINLITSSDYRRILTAHLRQCFHHTRAGGGGFNMLSWQSGQLSVAPQKPLDHWLQLCYKMRTAFSLRSFSSLTHRSSFVRFLLSYKSSGLQLFWSIHVFEVIFSYPGQRTLSWKHGKSKALRHSSLFSSCSVS